MTDFSSEPTSSSTSRMSSRLSSSDFWSSGRKWQSSTSVINKSMTTARSLAKKELYNYGFLLTLWTPSTHYEFSSFPALPSIHTMSYMHTYIYTYTHTYIHPYIHKYVHVHTYIHIYIHTYTHPHIYT